MKESPVDLADTPEPHGGSFPRRRAPRNRPSQQVSQVGGELFECSFIRRHIGRKSMVRHGFTRSRHDYNDFPERLTSLVGI